MCVASVDGGWFTRGPPPECFRLVPRAQRAGGPPRHQPPARAPAPRPAATRVLLAGPASRPNRARRRGFGAPGRGRRARCTRRTGAVGRGAAADAQGVAAVAEGWAGARGGKAEGEGGGEGEGGEGRGGGERGRNRSVALRARQDGQGRGRGQEEDGSQRHMAATCRPRSSSGWCRTRCARPINVRREGLDVHGRARCAQV